MKRLLIMLLVLAIAACPCALAEGEATIEDMVSANDVSALLDRMKGVGMNVTIYDDTGAEAYSFYDCAWRAADGMIMYAHESNDGSVEIKGRGDGYGYDAASARLYLIGYIGDTYEQMMTEQYKAFILNIEGGETILSEERSGDRLVITTTESIANTWYGDIGGTLETEHRLDAETLMFIEGAEYHVDESGKRTLLSKSWLTPDVEYAIPDVFDPMREGGSLRTVHIIAQPGTESEFDYVFKLRSDILLMPVLPDGWEMYSDAACTTPYRSLASDASDVLPEVTTIYAKPAEAAQSKSASLAGKWASIGSQDWMPFIEIADDGTLKAYDYEGATTLEGAYTLDEQTRSFTFPDGDQWTLSFEESDGTELLSTSTIGDDPVPVGTPILLFEREPQDEFDDGWIAFARVEAFYFETEAEAE